MLFRRMLNMLRGMKQTTNGEYTGMGRSPLLSSAPIRVGSCPFVVDYRSVPEYERLKLLFTTGKSGMMLPRIASVNAGQFCNEGSLTLHRARRFPGAV